jgi:hypothetical protein
MLAIMGFDLLAGLVEGVCWSLGSTVRSLSPNVTCAASFLRSFLAFFGEVAVLLLFVAFLDSF